MARFTCSGVFEPTGKREWMVIDADSVEQACEFVERQGYFYPEARVIKGQEPRGSKPQGLDKLFAAAMTDKQARQLRKIKSKNSKSKTMAYGYSKKRRSKKLVSLKVWRKLPASAKRALSKAARKGKKKYSKKRYY